MPLCARGLILLSDTYCASVIVTADPNVLRNIAFACSMYINAYSAVQDVPLCTHPISLIGHHTHDDIHPIFDFCFVHFVMDNGNSPSRTSLCVSMSLSLYAR